MMAGALDPLASLLLQHRHAISLGSYLTFNPNLLGTTRLQRFPEHGVYIILVRKVLSHFLLSAEHHRVR